MSIEASGDGGMDPPFSCASPCLNAKARRRRDGLVVSQDEAISGFQVTRLHEPDAIALGIGAQDPRDLLQFSKAGSLDHVDDDAIVAGFSSRAGGRSVSRFLHTLDACSMVTCRISSDHSLLENGAG